MRAVPLTTEEEGVAMLAGTWLGGERGVLLMQSSGIGNCVNMFSTIRVGRYPLFTLITMRGQWGEANPWQMPMGQNAAAILRLAGFQVLDRPWTMPAWQGRRSRQAAARHSRPTTWSRS